jgi:hypothetical protein
MLSEQKDWNFMDLFYLQQFKHSILCIPKWFGVYNIILIIMCWILEMVNINGWTTLEAKISDENAELDDSWVLGYSN